MHHYSSAAIPVFVSRDQSETFHPHQTRLRLPLPLLELVLDALKRRPLLNLSLSTAAVISRPYPSNSAGNLSRPAETSRRRHASRPTLFRESKLPRSLGAVDARFSSDLPPPRRPNNRSYGRQTRRPAPDPVAAG
ncbi:hypothetical protein V6N13_094453 [Hibiscus sabdariffa]